MYKTTKLIGAISIALCFYSTGIVKPAFAETQEPPTQKPLDREYPTQVSTDQQGGIAITWELKSCAKKTNHVVSCMFSFISSENIDNNGYSIYSNNETKLVDNEGNEYHASKITLKNRIIGPNSILSLSVYKDAQYKITVDFNDIPDSVLYAIEMNIRTNTRSLNQRWPAFSNFPFINLDGSISEVPISKHPKKTGQQTSDTNNSSTPVIKVPRICLPFIGCR